MYIIKSFNFRTFFKKMQQIAIKNGNFFKERDLKSKRTKCNEARYDIVLLCHPFHLETLFTKKNFEFIKPCQTTLTLDGEWKLTRNEVFCGNMILQNKDIGYISLECKFIKRRNYLECCQIKIIGNKSQIKYH